MNSFKITSTTVTPEINFDIDNNTLTFLKVSKPANAIEFYRPLFEYIDNFEKKKIKSKEVEQISIDFKFDYYNTSSAKVIYELLGRFKKIEEQGVKININWYYHSDDDDLLEEGEIMSEAVNIPFNYIII